MNQFNPFHGEFNFDGSVTDASNLSEADARFNLYKAASNTQISTLLSTDIVEVTDILMLVEANITVTLYDGSDNTISAGELIAFGTPPANGGWALSAQCSHFCQAGTFPKMNGSASGVIRCIIRGHIHSGSNSGNNAPV